MTVSAEDIPLMKTDRSDVATTFGEKEVESLPLSIETSPAWNSSLQARRSSVGSTSRQNPQGGIQIMVNGQHFSGTSFQLDGTDNRDPVLGIIVINPTLESVTQTKVTTQNYDAEFGQAMAGVVTVQTKSGTNDCHGSAFEFRRTGWGQARNPLRSHPTGLCPLQSGTNSAARLAARLSRTACSSSGTIKERGVQRSFGALDVPTAMVRSTCLDSAVPFCDFSEYPQAYL